MGWSWTRNLKTRSKPLYRVETPMSTYTLKVSRIVFPGWKKYENVVQHKTEVIGNTARLFVEFSNGAYMTIPHVERRYLLAYSLPIHRPAPKES